MKITEDRELLAYLVDRFSRKAEAGEALAMTESTPVGEKKFTERCQGIKNSGTRCKCYRIMQINGLWYCKQHGEKELRKAK